MHDVSGFEKSILIGLKSCGIEPSAVSASSPLGLAVSGGADSVSLLVSLASLFDSLCLRVITVDHGIRPEEESGGDASFVRALCERLSVPCTLVKIPHGKIESDAKSSGGSVEALARKFRYEAFDSFIKNENLCALCLAHNQNDQCETLIMRFLQGSAGEGMGGIARARHKIIRPLLDVSRLEIESYLVSKNQKWCTDSTNSDTKYLRNKIRNLLVPLLNENFSGWQKAVLSGAKKSAVDEDFFQNALSSIEGGGDSSKISRACFYSLHDSLKRRVFFSLLNKNGFGSRFPYRLFEEICSWKDCESREVSFEEVKVSLDSENLSVSRVSTDSCIESSFSFFLKKIGDRIDEDDLTLTVDSDEALHGNAVLSFSSENSPDKTAFPVSLPVCARGVLFGDEILTAGKSHKSVLQILSDWKIPEKLRDRVIVIEELCANSDSVRAVLASHLGFKNWIVEEAKV